MGKEMKILLASIMLVLAIMAGLFFVPFPRDTLWFVAISMLVLAAFCLAALAVLEYRDCQHMKERFA